MVEIAHRLAAGEPIKIRDLRGTAFMAPRWKPATTGAEANSTRIDTPGRVDAHPDP